MQVIRLVALGMVLAALPAAELSRRVLPDGQLELSWPIDGQLRIPSRIINGEAIPVVAPTTTIDGRHRLLLPADSDETIELRSRGAVLPLVTYEAEDAEHDGSVIRMEGQPVFGVVTPAQEASGRAFVELREAGDGVTFTALRDADGLFVRACLPDAAAGGGTQATLRLSVDGEERCSIDLDSRYAWVYGLPNGQSNDPADGPPHVFWDEFRCRIPGGLRAGQQLRLGIAAGDVTEYLRLDCIDLEAVPAAGLAPAGALSALDYGAIPDDGNDDTAALQACVAAAAAAGVEAWLPPGRYLQHERLRLSGCTLRGAGPWYTELVGTTTGGGWGGTVGVVLSGEDAGVCALAITSSAHTSRNDEGGKAVTAEPGTRRWLAEDLHLSHTNVGLWMSRAHDGVVRRCRVTNTYADGININCGSTGNTVEHCFVRGCGDDGIALLAEDHLGDPPSAGNVARSNTVSAIWWGHNLDLAGGIGQVVEDNLLSDNCSMGAFTVNLPGAFHMHAVLDALVRRNTIVRGGGDHGGQRRGAVWIYTGSVGVESMEFRHNQIIDAIFSAIHLTGSHPQHLKLIDNLVVAPAGPVLRIDGDVTGRAEVQATVLCEAPAGQAPITGGDRPDFSLYSHDNSWDQ